MAEGRLLKAAVRLLSKTTRTTDEHVNTEAAFEELYSATFSCVYAFIRSQVATDDVAQDMVSRVFLTVRARGDRLPSRDAAIRWVFRLAHDTLIEYWRGEGRHERVSIPPQALAGPATGPSALADDERRQRLSDLLQVVGDLPEQDRMMLALKFAGDRTNAEIAAILNVSEAAVGMRLLLALRRLKFRLESIGWNEAG